MKAGDVDVSLVSDGTIRVDGAAVYGPIPKVAWNPLNPSDSNNRVLAGLNCLLIRSAGKNILVDTGVGNKHPAQRKSMFSMRAGELVNDLRLKGIRAEDIHMVALTHLHFDHSGGCTKAGFGNKPVPTFSKAQYLVQRQDWYEATHHNERNQDLYFYEDFLPLEESNQLELLDGDTEVAPNIWLKVTGGHTSGHQTVFIDAGDTKVAFLGDLLPTPDHLQLHWVTGWDGYPDSTIEQKGPLLEQAVREGWLLVFCHSTKTRAGYIVRKDGHLSLDPEAL